MHTNQDSGYYPALTGIRAVAALLVYFHHFNPFRPWSGPWRLANEGHIGVTVFFVLSGFLITTRYFGRTTITRAWLGQYFRNRFARVYPLYFLLTSLTFLAFGLDSSLDATGGWPAYSGAEKVVAVLAGLTLVRGFFTQLFSSGIMQGWTLTVEESFYCLAPFLLVSLARSSARYQLLVVAVGLLALSGTVLVYAAPPHPYGLFGDFRFMAYRTFFGRAFEFMAGVGLAVYMRRQIPSRPGARVTSVSVAWLGACVLVLALLSSEQTYSWTRWSGIALNNLVLPVGITGLFYGLLTERTWLAWLLSAPLAQHLGKVSYAFYLVHMGIVSVALQRYVSSHMGLHFLALLALSLVLHRYVEVPLHRSLKRA